MNYTEKNIVKSYSKLLNGLSPMSKKELIASLSKSLSVQSEIKEDDFYKAFGGFSSDKSAEEIIEDIRASRKFKNKEIKF